MDELADACISGRLIPVVLNNTSIVEFFLNSKHNTLRSIWSYIILAPNATVPLSLLLSARLPYSTWIAPRKHLIFLQSKQGEDKIFIPPDTEESSLFTSYLATPVRKGFKNKRLFQQL
ncbi:hypothetical protein BLA29_008658 [Euroglyphus maynei]|uniref:Uncharacterized protein n=1 Tax=Euroglyphus maynei TaxID=6958 RepID=A0A1Y3B5Y1_EURMA|nr:hypothetical protein BLA29_008658 [Euroglyphus maynei]